MVPLPLSILDEWKNSTRCAVLRWLHARERAPGRTVRLAGGRNCDPDEDHGLFGFA